jgi:hypothetical protein
VAAKLPSNATFSSARRVLVNAAFPLDQSFIVQASFTLDAQELLV